MRGSFPEGIGKWKGGFWCSKTSWSSGQISKGKSHERDASKSFFWNHQSLCYREPSEVVGSTQSGLFKQGKSPSEKPAKDLIKKLWKKTIGTQGYPAERSLSIRQEKILEKPFKSTGKPESWKDRKSLFEGLRMWRKQGCFAFLFEGENRAITDEPFSVGWRYCFSNTPETPFFPLVCTWEALGKERRNIRLLSVSHLVLLGPPIPTKIGKHKINVK